MPRIARVVIPGLPHHIVQRGVRSMPVFMSDDDRREYLELLSKYSREEGVAFWAWNLMGNHVHLLGVPQDEKSLARAFGEAHRRYTRMINFRENKRGHLFQERFFSCPIEKDGHLLTVGRYIEMNSVRAGLVDSPEKWPWSSAAYNMELRDSDPLMTERPLADLAGPWASILAEEVTPEEKNALELHLRTGRPLGDGDWVKELEKVVGRRLIPRKPGRH